jgi:hypothetical protein
MAAQMSIKIPRDTRLVEFASGWAMLLAALMLPNDAIYRDLVMHSPEPGWIAFLGVAGLLHLVAVYLFEQADMLRAVLSFVGGMFWMWVGMLGMVEPSLSGFSAFALGVGCFMAFVVNGLSVRTSWSH